MELQYRAIGFATSCSLEAHTTIAQCQGVTANFLSYRRGGETTVAAVKCYHPPQCARRVYEAKIGLPFIH